MATPYELLGISPQATRTELDAAYAAKRAAYDPRKVRELGDEFVQLASERTAELASAYHTLRRALAAPVMLPSAVERRRDRDTIIALVLLVLVAALVPLTRNIAVPERTVVPTGGEAAALTSQPAPDFAVQTLDGRPVRLSDFKGQVILINFWATWCPPCVRETPRLVRTYEKYRDQGFVVLGINTTYQDDLQAVTTFARDQAIPYPVLLDTDGKVGALYPARLMPSSYLIGRDGTITTVKVGEVDEAQLEEQVQALLSAPVTTP